MARWNGIEDAELDSRDIYTGSYGFQDNDALGKVWARTPKQWEGAIRRALFDAGVHYSNEYESSRAIRDQLWYVGPYAETVADVIADMEDSSRADELRDDIRTSPTGYVY